MDPERIAIACVLWFLALGFAMYTWTCLMDWWVQRRDKVLKAAQDRRRREREQLLRQAIRSPVWMEQALIEWSMWVGRQTGDDGLQVYPEARQLVRSLAADAELSLMRMEHAEVQRRFQSAVGEETEAKST